MRHDRHGLKGGGKEDFLMRMLALVLAAHLAVVPHALVAADGEPDASRSGEPAGWAWLDAYNVIWTTPSKDSGELMPCGGGDIGLNVLVEKGRSSFTSPQPIDRDVPSYFQSLEHLLRYCARPPFAFERLSVIGDADGRIARVRSVLPRHKAANWVGWSRGRKSTRPGANGGVELTPFEFLDRLADFVPPPRKHRHRCHAAHEPLISSVLVEEVPLTGLSLGR